MWCGCAHVALIPLITLPLPEFKKSLNEQVERAYYSMESSVFACYDNSSKLMQQKLEELLQVLDRIGKAKRPQL